MFLNDNINHDIISNMTTPQLKALCRELRGCILRTVMKNGGHLLEEFMDGEQVIERYEIVLD